MYSPLCILCVFIKYAQCSHVNNFSTMLLRHTAMAISHVVYGIRLSVSDNLLWLTFRLSLDEMLDCGRRSLCDDCVACTITHLSHRALICRALAGLSCEEWIR